MKKTGRIILSSVAAFAMIAGGVVIFGLHYQRSRGHFYFTASGGNTTVTLDNYELGTSPIADLTFPPGWYKLTIKTDFYTYTTPLRLTAQAATVVDWQIGDTIEKSSGLIYELLPVDDEQTQLSVETIPSGSLLTLDQNANVSLFTPWQTGDLAPGEHEAHLSLPGYQSVTAPIILTKNYRLKLTAKLAQQT